MAESNDLSSLPQADQDAIGVTLISLLTGFRERDADKLVGIYTSDADWVNAFGSVKKGGDEIVEYLRGLFSDDNFNAGTLKAPPETSVKVLTPEVVLVSAHLQVEGQKLVGGGEIEVRDNHSLRVLHRQADGSWLIASRCTTMPTGNRPMRGTRNTGAEGSLYARRDYLHAGACICFHLAGLRGWIVNPSSPRIRTAPLLPPSKSLGARRVPVANSYAVPSIALGGYARLSQMRS